MQPCRIDNANSELKPRAVRASLARYDRIGESKARWSRVTGESLGHTPCSITILAATRIVGVKPLIAAIGA